MTELITENGAVIGIQGHVLEPSDVQRGKESSREVIGDFEYRADAVVIASGGIGANLDLVKKNWPSTTRDTTRSEWFRVFQRMLMVVC